MFEPMRTKVDELLNLRASSILETIIGLIVTALIVSFVYLIWSFANSQLSNQRGFEEEVSDVNRLRYSLNRDFFYSKKIVQKDSVLFVEKFEQDSILYYFGKKAILRKQGYYRDTFKIQFSGIKLDTLINSKTNVLLQRFHLISSDAGKIEPLVFCKIIDPATVINSSNYDSIRKTTSNQ